MVKSVIDGVTTLYVSANYQIRASVVTKYYPGGAFRVSGTLYYSFTDHLGSTSITIDPDGNKTETRYKAWGEVRYTSGSALLTDKTYTGQRSYAADFGLMYYNARWYDSSVGRFAQADSIIPSPGNSQSWDRYAYVNNNPVNFVDPTGHIARDKWVEMYDKLYGDGENYLQGLESLMTEDQLKFMYSDAFKAGNVLVLANADGSSGAYLIGYDEKSGVSLVNIDTGQKNYGVFSSIADAKSVNLYIHDDQMFGGKNNYHSKTYKEASSTECPICDSTRTANLGDGRMKDMLDNHVDIHWSVDLGQLGGGLVTYAGGTAGVILSPSTIPAGPIAFGATLIAGWGTSYMGVYMMGTSLSSEIYIK